MNSPLETAVEAVGKAGELLREKTGQALVVHSSADHDIKLELDVQCQELLTRHLLKGLPHSSVLGEEGEHGDGRGEYRWIVDPIDGTVNFFYGLPHYCITVALQKRLSAKANDFETVAGVTLDPSRNELFTAEKGRGAFLNGRPIRVSGRKRIGESVMAIGFSKTDETAQLGLGYFQKYSLKAKKLRVMGAAALDLAYVASGRLDAYYEYVRIWDIAAGLLLVTEAGGRVRTHPIPGQPRVFATLAFNGSLPFDLQGPDLIET
jgi:myo-inositol-1(or 4)-monophosphatase